MVVRVLLAACVWQQQLVASQFVVRDVYTWHLPFHANSSDTEPLMTCQPYLNDTRKSADKVQIAKAERTRLTDRYCYLSDVAKNSTQFRSDFTGGKEGQQASTKYDSKFQLDVAVGNSSGLGVCSETDSSSPAATSGGLVDRTVTLCCCRGIKNCNDRGENQSNAAVFPTVAKGEQEQIAWPLMSGGYWPAGLNWATWCCCVVKKSYTMPNNVQLAVNVTHKVLRSSLATDVLPILDSCVVCWTVSNDAWHGEFGCLADVYYKKAAGSQAQTEAKQACSQRRKAGWALGNSSAFRYAAGMIREPANKEKARLFPTQPDECPANFTVTAIVEQMMSETSAVGGRPSSSGPQCQSATVLLCAASMLLLLAGIM